MTDTYSGPSPSPTMGLAETVDLIGNRWWIFVRTNTGWQRVAKFHSQNFQADNLRRACSGDVNTRSSPWTWTITNPGVLSMSRLYIRRIAGGPFILFTNFCLGRNIRPAWYSGPDTGADPANSISLRPEAQQAITSATQAVVGTAQSAASQAASSVTNTVTSAVDRAVADATESTVNTLRNYAVPALIVGGVLIYSMVRE